MPSQSIVEIPPGSGNRYRYEYEGGSTVYKGPVGDVPVLTEPEFMAAFDTEEPSEKITLKQHQLKRLVERGVIRPSLMVDGASYIKMHNDIPYQNTYGEPISIVDGLDVHQQEGETVDDAHFRTFIEAETHQRFTVKNMHSNRENMTSGKTVRIDFYFTPSMDKKVRDALRK